MTGSENDNRKLKVSSTRVLTAALKVCVCAIRVFDVLYTYFSKPHFYD